MATAKKERFFVIFGNYGYHGYEPIDCFKTWQEAKYCMKEYKLASPGASFTCQTRMLLDGDYSNCRVRFN